MTASIGSVVSTHVAHTTSKPEASEPTGAGGRDAKNDGDRDDAGGGNTVKPTMNIQGQPIGQVLNTKA